MGCGCCCCCSSVAQSQEPQSVRSEPQRRQRPSSILRSLKDDFAAVLETSYCGAKVTYSTGTFFSLLLPKMYCTSTFFTRLFPSTCVDVTRATPPGLLIPGQVRLATSTKRPTATQSVSSGTSDAMVVVACAFEALIPLHEALPGKHAAEPKKWKTIPIFSRHCFCHPMAGFPATYVNTCTYLPVFSFYVFVRTKLRSHHEQ